MKYNRVISTAVLLLLLGTTIPAFAQKGKRKRAEENPRLAQHEQQPQPARKRNRSSARERHSRNAPKKRRHSAHRKRSHNAQKGATATAQRRKRSHNARKRNSPQGPERRPLLTTVAAVAIWPHF